MTQTAVKESTRAGEKRGNSPKVSASVAVRIKARSKDKIESLLAKVNRDRVGRRVKADDLICFSLDLLTDAHLEEISAKLMSNKERIEVLYKKLSKSKRGLSREEFFGMLLEGRVTV